MQTRHAGEHDEHLDIEELQRANAIHERTLEAWRATMRERGEDEWWKGGEG